MSKDPLLSVKAIQTEIGAIQNQPSNIVNYSISTRYRFNLKRIPNTVYFGSSANVPGITISKVQQATNFNPVVWSGGAVVQDDFVIKFVVDENLKNWIELRNWILSASDYEDFKEYRQPEQHMASDGILTILNSNQNPIIRINFNGLFPIGLQGLSYVATEPEAVEMTSMVTFGYTTYTIQEL